MRWDGVVEEWAAPIRESSADRSNALLRSAAMDGRFVILAITDDRWKKETARLGERAVGVAMGRRGNDVGSPATAPLGYGQQPFIKLTFA